MLSLTDLAVPTGKMHRVGVASLLTLVLVALVGALVMFSGSEANRFPALFAFTVLFADHLAFCPFPQEDVMREARGELIPHSCRLKISVVRFFC